MSGRAGKVGSVSEERYSRAVAADCREFLSRQSVILDPAEHVFGYEHQTRLRAVCVLLGVGDPAAVEALVDRYWSDPSARAALRLEALGRQIESATPALAAPRFTFSETRRDHFDAALIDTDGEWIVNDYGIARLEALRQLAGPVGASYELLPADRPSSIGMLMFYGFSPGPGRAVLQELPVRLLAATVAWCAAHGAPPASRDDWTIERLVDACRRAARHGELESAALDAFLLHEAGHLPETLHPVDPLHVLMAATGTAPERLVSGAFPTPTQRLTWPRLQERPSLADALYMLGDVIANARALAFGTVTDATWAFLQAFNWRFVPSAGPLRIPRGNLALLLDKEPHAALARGMAILLDVVAAHERGATSCEVLLAVEQRLWQALAEVR